MVMEKRIIELPKALVEGFILEKECKSQGTGGAIYLHKNNIGKKFKVILLPMKGEFDDLEDWIREKYPNIIEEFLKRDLGVKDEPSA